MSKRGRALLGASSFIAIIAGAAVSAQAQDQTMETVVVTGIRGSMRDALVEKRLSVGVMEVVSTKEIGVLPDVTIAETLARLPGLNTVRDRGNDSQAAIRGIGPRMVLGLINGREMASSEPDRNVRWEIFPSEVVAGVQVHKSSQADLVSGGISGTVDIQTLRPLDYTGPSLTLRAGPAYYEGGSQLPHQGHVGYRASGAFVTQITPKLGFVVAASLQDQQNGYESVGGGGWNSAALGYAPGPIVATPGAPIVETPWGASADEKAIDTKRGSISSSVQWKPSSSFEGRVDFLFSRVSLSEHDDGGWYTDWGNWAGYNAGGYTNNVVENGALVKTDMTFDSTYHPYVSRYKQFMNLMATGANAKWSLEEWTVAVDASYSQAERAGIWQAVEMYDNAGHMSYDYTGSLPSVYASTDAYQAAKNGQLFANTGQADVNHLRDTMETANLDVKRDLKGFFDSLQFGLRFSNRAKQDDEPRTVVHTTPLSWTAPVDVNMVQPWNYGYFKTPTMVSGNFDKLATALYGAAGLTALNADYEHDPFTSKVKETVIEGYVMGSYVTSLGSLPLDGNVGIRVVGVDSSSFGPSNGTNITVSNNYIEVLPSFNARLDFGDGSFVKFGASRAMSRPPLNDLRVDRSFSTTSTPYTGGGGNPNLKPYLADQVDLSYEKYFHDDGLVAVAAFYKRIHNYIGYDTRSITIPGVTLPVTFTSPFNATHGGNLEGLEFTFQTPFYFIPYLEKFGIYSNLALTSSDIHEFFPAAKPLPMNGVAKTTGILDLWYSDDRLDARLGLKYHSSNTVLFTWVSSALQTQRAETQLDYSMGYKLTDKTSVRLQAGNLLNTPLRLYDNNNPSEIARNDVYGRHYLLDVTFKY